MKQITVKELKKQLEVLEHLGMGNMEVWFRDDNGIDHEVTEGVYETDSYNVVLG